MAAVDAVLAASSARERLGLPSGEKLSAAGLAQARRGHSNVDSLCSVRKCFSLGCIKTQRASYLDTILYGKKYALKMP